MWRAITGKFDLEPHELEVLKQIVVSVDLAAAADAIVAAEGLIIRGESGPKQHPAAIEGRLQRQTFTRLLASLRLPVENDDGTVSVPQYRGPRGPYALAGGE